MPPRGRKPRPTKLVLLAGETRASRVDDDEPQPDETVPDCPSTDKVVREVWDYTVKQLRRMDLATMADRDVLLAYCTAVAAHRRATEVIEQEGTFIRILNTLQPHPALKLQRESAAQIRQLGTEFGLSPSSRTRIRVGAQKPQAKQDSSRLLTG